MRLSVTIHDPDRGALEVASVDNCETLTGGCRELYSALAYALRYWGLPGSEDPNVAWGSTATVPDATIQIQGAIELYGEHVELPVCISC